MSNDISTAAGATPAKPSGAFNFAFVSFDQTQIDAGNIKANQIAGSNSDGNIKITLEGHTEFFALDHDRIDNSNRGDYHVRAGGATNDFVRGVFIASVARNGVDWGFGDGTEYGAAAIGIRGDNSLFVSVNNSRGAEYNTDVSVANFDFERYLGAWVRDNGNRVTTAGQGTSRIHTERNADASFTVRIDGVNSLTDGVLLITGAENRAQYGAARPLADGSGWIIDVHDNNVDGYANTGYEFGFTYLPKGDVNTTFGRIMSDGSSEVANGDYTINKIGTGEYELYVNGRTPADGALIVTAEGLDGANIDNVVSYQPMANGKGWIVQTRDFPSTNLEDAGNSTVPDDFGHMNGPVDPNFAGVPVETIIASYQDAQDGNTLIAAHRAGYWENGVRILPENSIPSIERAIALGADIVEIDLMKTKDGHYVVMHDGNIDRTTTGRGNVSDLTLEQIRAEHLVIEGNRTVTDERVPTLEEALAAIDGKVMVNLDKVAVSQFAEVSAIAAAAGVADQCIFKAAISTDAELATVKAALAQSAPGIHFMPIMYPGVSAEFVAKVFAELGPDAVEINVYPNSFGWTSDPGPFFTPAMKAVFDQYDVRYFINTLFDGQGNDDGSMSGGRGDFVALGRPDLVYGYWADQGVSIIQTDELRIAANYLNAHGYRQSLVDDGGSATPGDDLLTGTAGDDALGGLAGDDVLSGLAGNDTLDGGADDDTLLGGEGNDALAGGSGDDDLDGGAGNDALIGGAGDDVLKGGDGVDTADYSADTAGVVVNLATGSAIGEASGQDELSGIETVLGGAGNDALTGDAAANTLNGGAGNDALDGGAGDDTLIGGEGSDTLVLQAATGAILLDLTAGKASAAGLGTDSFTGIEAFRLGAGDDVVTLVAASAPVGPIDGGAGHDRLVLTGTGTLGALTGVEQLDLAGNWTVTGHGANLAFQDGAQTLAIEAGFTGTLSEFGQDDRIQLLGFTGAQATLGAGNLLTVTGGAGATLTLHLDPADDYAGMAFTVSADGLGGSYLSYGPANAGDDVFSGGNGSDAYDGGAGNDAITGGAGDDTLLGNLGNDSVDGGSGADSVSGGTGDDVLKGGSGIDVVDGGDGNDTIDAGSDADTVNGGAGDDVVKGGSGDDRLTGGAGDDALSGGSGHDSFVFAAGFGHDAIGDFTLTGSGSDTIQFDADVFAGFAAVQDAAEQVGHDVVITLDDHNALTLSNTALASLTADDFRFAA
ncbi:hypothetical protein DWF00_16405 [Bosea caraganae]|uniref:GP-PDE domain-containing protein n=1 Tax=Bosea caraganae TaxID=2763117 RepID=A0A370KYP1_9HYPH|nr:glycerophosphodiester phosphodiesterase family protein [Bosea caraganae]RDJ20095.1 hypothetical protein DWE98_26010 [Bosea caraganae]RDJ24807.1 hypothetical protein DWF00_16405 [Bosea caraganae]